MDELLQKEVAAGYARGWSFTPLRGKAAYLDAWNTRPRETLQEALAWAAAGNVGLRLGPASGIVIIDDDTGDFALPVSWTIQSGREGTSGGGKLRRSVLFKTAEGFANSPKYIFGGNPHVEFLRDGHQSVFVGSIHPETGTQYRWMPGRSPADIPLAELPQYIINLATTGTMDGAPPAPAPLMPPAKASAGPAGTIAPPADPQGVQEITPAYARAVLERECRELEAMPANSGRNNRLNVAAWNVGSLVQAGALGEMEAKDALAGAAQRCGLEDKEIFATIESGFRTAGKKKRAVKVKADAKPAAAPMPAGALDVLHPSSVARAYLEYHQRRGEVCKLRRHQQTWLVWTGKLYSTFDPDDLKSHLREYLEAAHLVKNGRKVHPSITITNESLAAMEALCNVRTDLPAPAWLAEGI